MVKKEKGSSTPAPRPVRVPQTRGSNKKRAADSIVNLDAYEDLNAIEATTKILSVAQHLMQLLKSQADELREANERWEDLQKIAAAKDEHYKNLATKWEADALARENLAYEDAKVCAATSVYQAMYDMAKEAAELDFLHPNWDVGFWAQVLERPEIVKKVAEKNKAGDGVGDGVGTSGGALVGDEGDTTA